MNADPSAPEATCKRSWYSTWSSCKCLPCRTARARYRKLVDAGAITRTSSDDAWEALDRMIAGQWTGAAIASASGLPNQTIHHILTELRAGHRRKIGATIAARIVNHGAPTRGHIGATTTRRKLQALAVMGHTQLDIAAAAGTPGRWTTIDAIQTGRTKRLTPTTAASIDQAWKTLTRVPGTSTRANQRATDQGWYGVGAWNDIDDPNEAPQSDNDISNVGSTARRALELTEQGLTRAEIAARLGMKVDSVNRALRRKELQSNNKEAA